MLKISQFLVCFGAFLLDATSRGRPQTQTEKVLEELFGEILSTLRNFDYFGRLHSPSIFLVYAHDPPNARNAHVPCVRDLIEWLQMVGAHILSDRSLLLEVSIRQSGGDAVRDILANQICLLPVRRRAGNKEVVCSVDKVLLCGSDVLREYCESDAGSLYMDAVERLCIDALERGIHPEDVQDDVRKVMKYFGECGNVHHVHTELPAYCGCDVGCFVRRRKCGFDASFKRGSPRC